MIYLLTMAPGLTWANGGADGGDLITAAATGGIPHPTGYPVYLLMAKLFQALPVGPLAFRTNLMSAIMTSFAAVLLYWVVIRFLDAAHSDYSGLAALVAGYAFGLSPLIWSQAVITEVYALQALLIMLVLYLSTGMLAAQKRLDSLCGLSLGLSMGNHITIIFLIPFVLLAKAINKSSNSQGGSSRSRAFLYQSVFFVLGLSVYLILPLRALSNPPINWGNPHTFDSFWWLVSGRLYTANFHPLTLAELFVRVQAWAALLVQQWGILGLLLAFVGLVYFFSPSPLYFLSVWQAIVYFLFSLIYGSSDSYIYLFPVCISFSIWLGLGLSGIANSRIVHKYSVGIPVCLMLLIYLFGLAAYHWPQVDASTDTRAEHFGAQLLKETPLNAIVFAEGDQAVFTAWYFHFALGKRPDLAIIATDLLHFTWYSQTLRSVYPSLIISSPLPWPGTIAYDNPSRPVCYARYTDQPSIGCSYP